ncbi:hypothetical protein NG798_25305, partial [Ancylothrix sp. C2]|nr:hypothetical protein [Ancylothrix sp. D3o]
IEHPIKLRYTSEMTLFYGRNGTFVRHEIRKNLKNTKYPSSNIRQKWYFFTAEMALLYGRFS